MSTSKNPRHGVERTKRLVIVQDLYTRGMSNERKLAAATGVAVSTISKDLAIIRREWMQETVKDMREQLELRTQQLLAIAYQARHAFDISQQPLQEIKTQRATCEACKGEGSTTRPDPVDDGLYNDDDDNSNDCSACGGTGDVVTESVSTRQHAGDARFLAVATKCIVEAAKMGGLYIGSQDPAHDATHLSTVNIIHNTLNVQDGGSNPFLKASPQRLLEAKAALAACMEEDDDANVIDVEVESKLVDEDNGEDS